MPFRIERYTSSYPVDPAYLGALWSPVDIFAGKLLFEHRQSNGAATVPIRLLWGLQPLVRWFPFPGFDLEMFADEGYNSWNQVVRRNVIQPICDLHGTVSKRNEHSEPVVIVTHRETYGFKCISKSVESLNALPQLIIQRAFGESTLEAPPEHTGTGPNSIEAPKWMGVAYDVQSMLHCVVGEPRCRRVGDKVHGDRIS